MDKSRIRDIVIKVILVTIIVVLLVHNCSLIRKNNMSNDNKQPNGNVDVFEINCTGGNCKKDDKEKEENTTPVEEDTKETLNNNSNNNNNTTNNNSGHNTNNNTGNNNNHATDEIDETLENTNTIVKDDINLSNNGASWSSTNNLRIFTNSMYSIEPKILPESSNVYKFVVKNNTNYNVKYLIKFLETNPYDINMRYRLKRGNNYVVGNDNEWVIYSALNLNNISLNANTDHIYYLEWKWVSSDNDTEIGSNVNASYKLDIKIEAEGSSG